MGLRVRRFEEKDLLPLYELLSDEEVMRYIEPPFTLEQTKGFLEKTGLFGSPLIYAVDDEDGVFVGYVIYHDYESDSMEIGWVLKRDVWGKGYAESLTNQLVDKAESEGKSVIIECVPEQNVTKHIAEKAGFSYIGRRGECEVFKRKMNDCSRISITVPKYEELWFRQKMMADPDTMSYNHAWGGTIPFPEEDWKAWYDFWIIRNENKRYYRYLKDGTSGFVGEIAYHYDVDRCIYVADVIVYGPCRGKGYGKQALNLLCRAAKENGVNILYDDIAIDNPAVSLFLKNGFKEQYRTDEIIMLKKEL